jgi:hypothetical protein
MDFKKEFKSLIKTVKTELIRQKLPSRNEDIASTLGYNRTYLSGLLGKKGVVTEDHIKQVKLHYPFLYENVTRETPVVDNKVSDGQAPYGQDKMSLRAIMNLTEANKKAIDNITILAESNNAAVKTNEELVSMLKKSIDNAQSKTTVSESSKIRDFLAIVAQIGVGITWQTEEEGRAALNKFVPLPTLEKSEKGTHAG